MGRRLYVGNLPYSATEEQLTELFGRAGKVDNVRVMRDMATGRARGFAFVEMSSDDEAQKAITEFHEQQMDGRALVVNEARPKPEGGFGGGGGAGRGGGGYRGGGGGGGGRRLGGRGLRGGRGAAVVAVAAASTTATSAADGGRSRAGNSPKRTNNEGRRSARRLLFVRPRYSSTTHPSRRFTTRLPYAALASECVTWMIVVPPS